MNQKVNGVWIMHSPDPLPNELINIKRVYIVIVICILIGLFAIESLFWLGIFALVVWYSIDERILTRNKWHYLRKEKFKFVSGVTYDDIFNALQPRLISKYGSSMQIERTESGSDRIVSITYDNIIYEIYLESDTTFRIRWGMSIGRALFSFRDYKNYQKTLAAMGMIGFELQQAFDVK